jgi:hypothetical protein
MTSPISGNASTPSTVPMSRSRSPRTARISRRIGTPGGASASAGTTPEPASVSVHHMQVL